jgi:two-component system, NarL family, nitrate/nitrite response regulator NarL
MNDRPPVRVLVVDDHASIRTGIRRLIDGEAPRLCTVGCVATADEADVVVLDVNLGGEDGLVLIPAMRRLAPCEVVVLTSLSDPAVERMARALGATAHVHKTAPAQVLLDSIETAHLRSKADARPGQMPQPSRDEVPRTDSRMR